MPEKPLQVRLEVTDQHSGQYTLNFDSSQYPVTVNWERNIALGEWLRRLHPVLTSSNDPARNYDPQDLLRNVGIWLWQALLPENAPAQEREALMYALRAGRTPLLLALPDTLAELPWELLCDPEQSGEKGFLARCRPLMRLSTMAPGVTPIEPPLRVLLLISSPVSLGEDSRIDVESERAAVEQATREMREAGFLHLHVEDILTPKRVQQVLMRFKPHIVHYIGHGGYTDTSGGLLLWEDEQGSVLELPSERLADLLRPRNLHAVILHACQTGRSNARTNVRGVAGTLVKEGIPTVLAQQANFTYESSQRASEAWYTALMAGQSMTSALFEVRQALIQAERPDWAVPILQGSVASLAPVLNATSLPGSPDPLLTSVGAVTDLPTPTGIFVGRHRELRALRLMLESMPGSGPVMALITGPGGVGKSTLVAQAVTRYGRAYKATLTLRCQGYQNVDLFLQRIGEFLKGLGMSGFLEQRLPGPKLSTEAKIEEAIVALNAAGPLLLIIDNLESAQNEDQMISDEGLFHLLQKLLTNLRSGRVLITGRYAVKDLLPQGKFAANLRHLDLSDLSSYETNQLLMRHPALAQLGETVREKLIDEFGGLPYVYDLLSSDAASQSLDLLIHDVQGRVTLAQKQHTAKEWQEVRQQVIDFAALEVIVSRLSGESRDLLAQLSVLHQPFPLAAIEEGLGAARTVLQPLLNWSLLHFDPHEKSYHLHNLTRRYAEDLLEEQHRKQSQAQLAAWYEHYASQASHNLADALEAHRLLRAAGRMQQAGQLVMQLADALTLRGLYLLLRDLCTKTLNDIGESSGLLAASSLYHLGNLAYLQGEYEKAYGLSQQSLDIFESLGNQGKQAESLGQLGKITQDQGEYEQARGFYQQSLDIFERLGDQAGQAYGVHLLGWIAQLQGQYKEARGLYQKSLAIRERLGNRSGQADCLHHLGWIAQLQGQYKEARVLYQQSLDITEREGDQHRRAATLHHLGWIAQDQGEYEEARGFHRQSLDLFERLGNQRGRAASLQHLGMIAQGQEEYEEARSLYQQSLAIRERLGDQSGRAYALAQLGNLAYMQGEYEDALMYMIQAYIIFDALGSPNCTFAQHIISKIHSHMDEETFITQWRILTGDYPLPILPAEDIPQPLRQVVIGFIQTPTLSEAKRFLEAHLELLQPEIDVLLQEFATQQEQDGARKAVEERRLLLARCRDKGIDVAFAETYEVQSPEVTFASDLNNLCNEVVVTLQTGNTEQREVLATRIEQTLKKDLPVEDVQNFLLMLLAWLREQDALHLTEKLQSPFREIYAWMVAAVVQEETGDINVLMVEELPNVVSFVILHGTDEQRQQVAAGLVEAQQDLSPEVAPLGRFFGCLVAALRGETPRVSLLEPPFVELWKEFQKRLRVSPDESSQQEEEKDG